MKKPTIAVVGATGAVGQTIFKVLEERNFPFERIVPLASTRSAGKKIVFSGQEYEIMDLGTFDFKGVDLALFSAGGDVSLKFAPKAAKAGAVVVDNTSAFRMEPDVPLVIPEVNPQAAKNRPRGIIANPNCSTIQMLVALSPLHRRSPIKRIIVSTYQAVSGAGLRAIEELKTSSQSILNGNTPKPGPVFSHVIAFNCLPQIDKFMDDGYTKEEHKMMNETRKILEDDSIKVSATCVRVPVEMGHAESINVETESPVSVTEIREILAGSPGVEIIDDPSRLEYPLQSNCAGKDITYVGRIRKDPSNSNCLDMWVVADNLRKGAATNAVQIGELLL